MVAGHILDAVDVLHSRVRGKKRSGNREMSHNFVMHDKLKPWVKWAFWFTNVPYWIICGLALYQSLPAKALQHPVAGASGRTAAAICSTRYASGSSRSRPARSTARNST